MGYLGNVARAVFGPLRRGDTPAQGVTKRASGWNAAMNSRRFIKWVAQREHLNTLLYAEGERLRDRARDLGRQNPWAASAIESMTANVIGTGIKPQSRHPKKEVRENLNKLWSYFVANSDADRRTDFYGQQALAFRSMVESGEVLGRTRYRRSYDNFLIPMVYQLIESEYLTFASSNGKLENGNTIQAGIEFDKLGQRVAYHIFTSHPYDYAVNGGSPDTTRIKADQIDHMYKMVRPGQLRGVSWLGPALAKLYDLAEYDDSELLRKKFSAMFVGFITETDEADPVVNTTVDENAPAPLPDETDSARDQGIDFAEMQAGTMVKLDPNESITFSEPEDVGGMYGEFMKQQLHAIAAAIGCMYEMMTGDVSEASYSSIRSSVLEFRRKAEQWQFSILCYQLCQPVWERFIRSCALAGLIDAADFNRNPLDYLVVDWRTPLWAWVDPEKDIKAEILAVRAGFKSRTTSIAERGEDSEVVDAEITADNKRADAAGLVFDTDSRNRDQAGKAIAVPGEEGGEGASAKAPPAKRKAADAADTAEGRFLQ